MFDILVSFGLGTLLGVCLTLLVLGIKNRRKAIATADDTETAYKPSFKAESRSAGQDANEAKPQDKPARPPVSSDFDELEGFVKLDGTPTEYPVFETKIPAEEIEEIEKVIPSDGHLENEWIEAERVEAARIESELREAARLEAMHHKTPFIEDDRQGAEELENVSLQQEFAALQSRQALQQEVARVEAEHAEATRLAAERVEAQKVEAVRAAKEQAEAERVAAERAAVERAKAERVAAERAAAERAAAERAAAERAAAERAAAEQAAAEQAAAEQAAAERAEAERAAAERAEAERAAAERAAAERAAAERAEAERAEAERAEAERAEAERIDAELLAQEFATLQAAQQAAELAAKEAATLEIELASKRAADEAAIREAQRQKLESDRIAAEQAAQDQLAKVEGASVAAEAESINIDVVKKIGKAPEDTLIMIADDSKVVRVKTSRVLIKHLYQVTLAEDGNEAASQLDFIMPDLLITDVEMPGMDGFELTHHLRSNPATAKLPIIMISGGSNELVEKAKLAGIDVLLGKPYSDEDLLGHIRRLTHGA